MNIKRYDEETETEVDVYPVVVSVSAKVNDLCFIQLLSEDDEILKEHDGHLPKFIPGSSDQIELEIDLATGRILNWNPNPKDVENFVNQGEL